MISFTQQWIIGDMIGQVHEHAFAKESWPYVFRSEFGDLPMSCGRESVLDVTKWWWVEVAGVRREKFEILRAWRLERHNRARALAQFDEWLSAGKLRLSKLLPAVVGKPTETEVSSSSDSEKPIRVGDIGSGTYSMDLLPLYLSRSRPTPSGSHATSYVTSRRTSSWLMSPQQRALSPQQRAI